VFSGNTLLTIELILPIVSAVLPREANFSSLVFFRFSPLLFGKFNVVDKVAALGCQRDL